LRREEHTEKGELRADETEFDVRVRLLGVPPGSEVPGIRGRRRGGGRGGGTTGRETGREKGGETVRYNDDTRIEYLSRHPPILAHIHTVSTCGFVCSLISPLLSSPHFFSLVQRNVRLSGPDLVPVPERVK
jgi:hypothetical protein